jgi:hypothetical protein
MHLLEYIKMLSMASSTTLDSTAISKEYMYVSYGKFRDRTSLGLVKWLNDIIKDPGSFNFSTLSCTNWVYAQAYLFMWQNIFSSRTSVLPRKDHGQGNMIPFIPVLLF